MLDIGAGKKRALLGLLLLHANEVVPTERLIDEVWGEAAPVPPPKIVQGYVSQLRKTFAEEATSADESVGGEILLTRPKGYVLQLNEEQLDADRFEGLVARARAALADCAAHEASILLREGLGLWRGPPLADLAFEAFAHDEVARLEELRLTAFEERIDADLALGRHVEKLVAELEAFVAREPLRERPRGQLMLALYRCGRQAEALQAYSEGRTLLVGELGIEPSRTLQQLEQAILRQDASLDVVVERQIVVDRPEPATPAPGLRPGSVFVGRERELERSSARSTTPCRAAGGLCLSAASRGSARADSPRSWRAGRRSTARRCTGDGAGRPAAHRRTGRGRRRSARAFASGVPSSSAWSSAWVPPRSPTWFRTSARNCRTSPHRPPLPTRQLVRFRLFDAIAGFVERASDSRPLVVVLDDLNWADKESLLLLNTSRGSSATRICCFSAPIGTSTSRAVTRSPRRWESSPGSACSSASRWSDSRRRTSSGSSGSRAASCPTRPSSRRSTTTRRGTRSSSASSCSSC